MKEKHAREWIPLPRGRFCFARTTSQRQFRQRFDYLGGGLPVGVEIWDGTGFDYYYLAYDQIGSLRYAFDEAGSVAKAITYDAFGNVLSDSNPSLKISLGFAGGHTDQATGLVRFVARDYDPEIGRWTSADPIGIQGGLNLYLYVGNDPVNSTDPYGLASSYGQRIADTALSHVGSTEWKFNGFTRHYRPRTNKCNVFVADMIREAGASLHFNRLVYNHYPGEILAGEWGDPNYPIAGWEVVTDPRPGDVASIPRVSDGGSGHVGVVVCRDGKLQTVSANRNDIGLKDWGFAPPYDNPVFRRYNPDLATPQPDIPPVINYPSSEPPFGHLW